MRVVTIFFVLSWSACRSLSPSDLSDVKNRESLPSISGDDFVVNRTIVLPPSFKSVTNTARFKSLPPDFATKMIEWMENAMTTGISPVDLLWFVLAGHIETTRVTVEAERLKHYETLVKLFQEVIIRCRGSASLGLLKECTDEVLEQILGPITLDTSRDSLVDLVKDRRASPWSMTVVYILGFALTEAASFNDFGVVMDPARQFVAPAAIERKFMGQTQNQAQYTFYLNQQDPHYHGFAALPQMTLEQAPSVLQGDHFLVMSTLRIMGFHTNELIAISPDLPRNYAFQKWGGNKDYASFLRIPYGSKAESGLRPKSAKASNSALSDVLYRKFQCINMKVGPESPWFHTEGVFCGHRGLSWRFTRPVLFSELPEAQGASVSAKQALVISSQYCRAFDRQAIGIDALNYKKRGELLTTVTGIFGLAWESFLANQLPQGDLVKEFFDIFISHENRSAMLYVGSGTALDRQARRVLLSERVKWQDLSFFCIKE